VYLFVWVLSFDLSGKVGLTSSYATAGIALWFIATRKHPYPAKDAFVKVEILQRARGRPKKNRMEGIRNE
jgi:hypothetical protein